MKCKMLSPYYILDDVKSKTSSSFQIFFTRNKKVLLRIRERCTGRGVVTTSCCVCKGGGTPYPVWGTSRTGQGTGSDKQTENIKNKKQNGFGIFPFWLFWFLPPPQKMQKVKRIWHQSSKRKSYLVLITNVLWLCLWSFRMWILFLSLKIFCPNLDGLTDFSLLQLVPNCTSNLELHCNSLKFWHMQQQNTWIVFILHPLSIILHS